LLHHIPYALSFFRGEGLHWLGAPRETAELWLETAELWLETAELWLETAELSRENCSGEGLKERLNCLAKTRNASHAPPL
jgi:hypothetical protein